MSRSATEAFGRATADRLAALAIDIACSAPERPAATVKTKVDAMLVAEARRVMADAGIDWRNLTRQRVERDREAYGRAQDAVRARIRQGLES